MRRYLRRIWALIPWSHGRAIKLSIDVLVWTATIPLAFYLRLESEAWTGLRSMLTLSLLTMPLAALVAFVLGFHRQSWGVVSSNDLKRLVLGVAAGTAILFAEVWLLQPVVGAPRSIPIISGALAISALGGLRIGLRWLRESPLFTAERDSAARRVLILGAGEAGGMLARQMLRHPEMGYLPVGFLDDDPSKRLLTHAGIKVLGSLDELPARFRERRAEEAFFAIPSASLTRRRDIFELAARHHIPIRNVPALQSLLGSRSPGQVLEALSDFVLEGRARNILLIGGAGYIGSALIPLLLERGYRVRVLDLMLYGDAPIEGYLKHPKFELVRGDFRQVHHLVQSLQGVDTVIHLGGLVGDPACAVDEDLTIEINLMATKVIAEAAKGYGVSKFIFASTCSVYGASDGILDEESALNPVSLYARTKIASERILLKLADERFAPTILRFGTVYGFSGRTRFDLVVNTLTAKAVREGVITLYGGDQWRPFVHVCDVAKAVLTVMEAPVRATGSRTFNVGSDEQNYTLADVAKHVNGVVPQATIVDHGTNSDRRNYRVSFRRVREEIGFKPDWTIEMGISQVADALRSGRITDYKGSLYSNVGYLKDQGLERIVRREYGSVLDVLEDANETELPVKR